MKNRKRYENTTEGIIEAIFLMAGSIILRIIVVGKNLTARRPLACLNFTINDMNKGPIVLEGPFIFCSDHDHPEAHGDDREPFSLRLRTCSIQPP